jgi:hypothetical protein
MNRLRIMQLMRHVEIEFRIRKTTLFLVGW